MFLHVYLEHVKEYDGESYQVWAISDLATCENMCPDFESCHIFKVWMTSHGLLQSWAMCSDGFTRGKFGCSGQCESVVFFVLCFAWVLVWSSHCVIVLVHSESRLHCRRGKHHCREKFSTLKVSMEKWERIILAHPGDFCICSALGSSKITREGPSYMSGLPSILCLTLDLWFQKSVSILVTRDGFWHGFVEVPLAARKSGLKAMPRLSRSLEG